MLRERGARRALPRDEGRECGPRLLRPRNDRGHEGRVRGRARLPQEEVPVAQVLDEGGRVRREELEDGLVGARREGAEVRRVEALRGGGEPSDVVDQDQRGDVLGHARGGYARRSDRERSLVLRAGVRYGHAKVRDAHPRRSLSRDALPAGGGGGLARDDDRRRQRGQPGVAARRERVRAA